MTLQRRKLAGGRVPVLIAQPASEPPYPAVVVAHGLGASKETQVPLITTLAGHGYLAVAFDLRGHRTASQLSRARPTAARAFMNLVARLSLQSALDIAALVDDLRRNEVVNRDRVALCGNSLGCHAVLAAIPLSNPACAVAGWGNADWDLMWRLSWPEFHPDHPAPSQPHWSPAVAKLIADLDPIHTPEAFFPTPLLLMHGEDDHPMLDGMLSLYEKLRPTYTRDPERLHLHLFPGGHRWPDEATTTGLRWLNRWLS